MPIIASGADMLACAQTGLISHLLYVPFLHANTLCRLREDSGISCTSPLQTFRQSSETQSSQGENWFWTLLSSPTAGPCRRPLSGARLANFRRSQKILLQKYVEALVSPQDTKKLITRSVLYGGAEWAPQRDELCKGCDVLIATPGRLLDGMMRNKVGLDRVRYIPPK